MHADRSGKTISCRVTAEVVIAIAAAASVVWMTMETDEAPLNPPPNTQQRAAPNADPSPPAGEAP